MDVVKRIMLRFFITMENKIKNAQNKQTRVTGIFIKYSSKMPAIRQIKVETSGLVIFCGYQIFYCLVFGFSDTGDLGNVLGQNKKTVFLTEIYYFFG